VSVLADTLKVRREELGYGQEQVAQHLGVSQQTISRWEKGLALPRPGRVVQLAELLELDARWLHRVAGYLPVEERSEAAGPWLEIFGRVAELSHTELMLLLDRVWEELRSREGLRPPGTD
jgi:transcriptional regulator with XRE-family HTH domain